MSEFPTELKLLLLASQNINYVSEIPSAVLAKTMSQLLTLSSHLLIYNITCLAAQNVCKEAD